MKGMFQGGQEAAKTIMKDTKQSQGLIADVETVANENRDTLSEYWEAITLMFSMMKDYFDKKYDKIPVTSVALVIVSFLFVVSPFRVLPRWLPFGAFMERTLVLVLVLEFIKDDLEQYSAWKLQQDA